nr:hypothetical protein [Tanacetum cinerariifolium]
MGDGVAASISRGSKSACRRPQAIASHAPTGGRRRVKGVVSKRLAESDMESNSVLPSARHHTGLPRRMLLASYAME